MAKAAGTIQAPLRKFLYAGCVPPMQDSNGLEFPNQSDVKTEDEWYEFAAVAGGVSASQASNVPASSISPATSGGSLDCVVLETLSMPAKAKVLDVTVLDPAIASPAHEEAWKRKSYELNQHFQDSWVAKCPWVEPVMGVDGHIMQVLCKVCTDIEGREKLLVPKIDSLMKHAMRRRATTDIGKVKRSEYFYLGNNQHVKNERIFFVKGGETILTKVMAGVKKERRLKEMQMRCLFHVLQQGWRMADFTAMRELLVNLMVPEIPRKHWSQPCG